MKCPGCSERMEPSNASGVKTHTCLYCNGIWISGASMDQLFSLEGRFDQISTLLNDTGDATSSRKCCPACVETSLHILTVRDVQIDVCMSCHGVFLDEGEIRALLPTRHSADKNPVLGLILDILLGAAAR